METLFMLRVKMVKKDDMDMFGWGKTKLKIVKYSFVYKLLLATR